MKKKFLLTTALISTLLLATTATAFADTPAENPHFYSLTDATVVALPSSNNDCVEIANIATQVISENYSLDYRTASGTEGYTCYTDQLKNYLDNIGRPASVKKTCTKLALVKAADNIKVTNIILDGSAAYVDAEFASTLVSCNADIGTINKSGFANVGATKYKKITFIFVLEDGTWKINSCSALFGR